MTSNPTHSTIVALIAKELGVAPHQVAAAVALLDEGSTVPFIARYRKEVTGSLDDGQLRTLEERLLETKGQLAQAVSQNEKLTFTLFFLPLFALTLKRRVWVAPAIT